MSQVIGVIPARYGSTRFPGKPLAMILGKPMLAWVIEGAQKSRHLTKVMVATDDERIASVARQLGVEVAMTDPELASGSDRVWAAIKQQATDIVINIQGDEPLLSGQLLDNLVEPMLQDAKLEMATLGRILRQEDLESLATAKIVLNHKNEAIYFSRLPIPYSRVDASHSSAVCLKHIGLYAYRKEFLKKFCENGPVALEQAEGLEQLRALYLGGKDSRHSSRT
jgi:3-deoxy-manno-octulosonate cytidylyltransferase (CMP-KDO synthetase)